MPKLFSSCVKCAQVFSSLCENILTVAFQWPGTETDYCCNNLAVLTHEQNKLQQAVEAPLKMYTVNKRPAAR